MSNQPSPRRLTASRKLNALPARRPAASTPQPVLFLGFDDVVQLVRRTGVATCISAIAARIERDFLRWVEFDKTARALVGMFQKNFAKFEAQVDAEVRAAAPDLKLAAE